VPGEVRVLDTPGVRPWGVSLAFLICEFGTGGLRPARLRPPGP